MTDQPQTASAPELNILAGVQPNGVIVYQLGAGGIVNTQVVLPSLEVAESFLAGTTQQLTAAIEQARRQRLGLILPGQSGVPGVAMNGHQFRQPPAPQG